MTHFERSNPSYVKGRIQGIRGQDEKEHRLRGGGLCLRPGGPGQRLRAGPDPGGLLRQPHPHPADCRHLLPGRPDPADLPLGRLRPEAH